MNLVDTRTLIAELLNFLDVVKSLRSHRGRLELGYLKYKAQVKYKS